LGFVQIATNRAALGIAECERALALDRNMALAHGFIGIAKVFLGRGAETETHIQEALRLSPRDIFAHRWMHWVGLAKSQLGDDVEAVIWFRRCIEANRNFPLAHFMLAGALALIGELAEAQLAAQAGLELHPSFTISRIRASVPNNNPAFIAGRERLCEGMRMAGVPEV
jgi:tetratricopeptide (TPR) repeat protein